MSLLVAGAQFADFSLSTMDTVEFIETYGLEERSFQFRRIAQDIQRMLAGAVAETPLGYVAIAKAKNASIHLCIGCDPVFPANLARFRPRRRSANTKTFHGMCHVPITYRRTRSIAYFKPGRIWPGRRTGTETFYAFCMCPKCLDGPNPEFVGQGDGILRQMMDFIES
jgi:hypothetical protein